MNIKQPSFYCDMGVAEPTTGHDLAFSNLTEVVEHHDPGQVSNLTIQMRLSTCKCKVNLPPTSSNCALYHMMSALADYYLYPTII